MNMTSTIFTLPRAHGWLRAGLLLAMLGGCGGGVDSGGTGGAAVYASGPINGFGSIIVNGVRFDDSSPGLTVSDDDGGSRNKSELKLGMVVEVRGSAIATDASGASSSTASSITVGSEIVGPIGSISLGTSSFVVLGRTIDVQPTTTVFADVGGLAGLASNDIVEVYGLYNAAGDRFTATRIERKSGPVSTYRIRGPISGLVAGTPRFSIGSELIDYSALGSGLPANFINTAVVRVRVSATQQVPGVWNATQLRDGVSRPDDGQHSKLEGLIDDYTAAGFSIGGVPVTTGAGVTIAPPGSPLADGTRVEVEGTFANGVLAASRIEVEDFSGKPEFEFRGTVEAFTPNIVTLHGGISVGYDGNTQFKDIPPGGLALGAKVEIKARLESGTQLVANEIKFKP
jgi:hypothetical protein